MTYLSHIPNQVDPGHRGDDAVQGHNSRDRLTELARSPRPGFAGPPVVPGSRPGAPDRPRGTRRGPRQQPRHRPGKYGGGGAGTTWLLGSPDDVAKSLRKYQDLGITHFILSDPPYRDETIRVGDQLLRPLRSDGAVN
jgi:alkanesulfonate monooxygenase SsuD/methylene tetrahydromethanopterin reductase-like flavin-dependent oxidoreductase (luciferase family)